MIHNVYFWLNEGVTDDDRNRMESELGKLVKISHIARGSWGKPASTEDRDVIDKTYSYSISLEFDSMEKHDIYQDCPEHDVFIENCKALWKSVKVYDSDTNK